MSAAAATKTLPLHRHSRHCSTLRFVSDDLSRVLEPGEGEGWLARRSVIPLGYLGDEAKTARTFPTVGFTRWSVPGDRARLRADGHIELLGRDSVTINSGGEKIFAEEVERAMEGTRRSTTSSWSVHRLNAGVARSSRWFKSRWRRRH